ncbi:Dynein heavy chain 1, axonemal [Orchesella cincta]|uniref:Dynein heavy chain 1, axonemal n=1 Tax=Orchesella cincta TaxID=48709 RepID=A0A1D2MYF4_ORCCI|nr:Dynein heavy chain 1, axonemal [Orchesella cincta]
MTANQQLAIEEALNLRDRSDSLSVPLGNFIFSDSLRKPKIKQSKNNVGNDELPFFNSFCSQHQQPSTTNTPSFAKGHMPGHIPLTSVFHMESNRENRGPDDDGLEDQDLTAADGIVRVRKERALKKQVATSDALKIVKGEFTFPHRTYKPKCQIAYRVPPGQVPQAVMAERLHRIYKKTDINLVIQTLGIELSDLIPPPNYSENNERFYHEMMFRNRTKINGIDKKEVLAKGGRFGEYELENEGEETLHLHSPEADSTLSASSSGSVKKESNKTSTSTTDRREEEEEEEEAVERGRAAIHPFIQSKPPFSAQFPLSYFDNTEYDIRSGEDWCRLGWDEKEKRFYPLPGKAFLPLPLPFDKRVQAKAPSEATLEEILRKTPRLEKFRSWLLRERYNRQIRLVGLDPAKLTKLTPSEAEMAIVARLGSTVETQASLSDESVPDMDKAVYIEDDRLEKTQSKKIDVLDRVASMKTIVSDDMLEGLEDSNSDPNDLLRLQQEMKEEDQLNIVFKVRQAKRDDEMSEDADLALTKNDDAKKSVSLLSDVFSDLESLTMMGSDIITTVQKHIEPEATDAEDFDDDNDRLLGDGRAMRGLNRPVRSYFLGDYGINIPASPDIDPFEDGLDQYVLDFDKMKKVHIYDWRWVDVAVFDYHPGQNKFFVRSIHPPFVYAWVSKVYLCFDAEDPNKHGLRIKDAIKRRIEMENVMRYNLYVDCLPMYDFPTLEESAFEKIIQKVKTTSNIKTTPYAMQKVKREINLDYQRTIAEEKFQLITEKHPKQFKPWVQIPDKLETSIITNIEHSKHVVRAPHEFLPTVHLQNFEAKIKNIQKNSVIFTDEAWLPYKEITNICYDAKQKKIIITDDLLPMHLDDWENMQLENIDEVKRYLDEEWYELVVSNLQTNFEKLNKSWYNLAETNYDVYLMSKLSHFLELIKLMMQDTIRSVVKDSCVSFMELVKSYSGNIDPKTDWSWGDDLINSEYPPPSGLIPVWVIDMYLDPREGPKYSQHLSSFYRTAYAIFHKAITSCSDMPTLLMKVMPQMQFAALGSLRGVEESEAEMIELAHSLVKYTKLILLPLESYIRKYEKYREVWSLDITSYVKKLEESDPTAQDIKKLVEQNTRHMEQLEKEIPNDIKITAFRVVVDQVRDGILKRKKNLINSILDNYAFKLRKIIQKVQKDFGEMEKKLTTRSDDIEEVMELKGYVEIVPSLAARLESTTGAAIKDYEVFDHFLYQVSNEDTNAKWQCAIASNRILRLGREATKWLEEDYDRLLKVQQGDLSSLSDQVDSATLTVAGLVAFTELEKAQDVCQEIKKIWKNIKDLQEQSSLLNRRQKIFGLPLAQNEALNRLARDIEPFKNLWFTASDWLTVQETLFAGTLDKIDIDQVTKVIHDGGKVIGRCIKYFAGADQIQHIAISIKHQLEEFKPLVPLVSTLKKTEMRQRHWQAMSDICGFTVVEKAGQNFKKLLEHGISDHVKEITEIGDLATKEYEVEYALNRMNIGIGQHQIGIDFDHHLKVPVVLIHESTLNLIDDYIKVTDEILKNPFNAAFQERLSIWDKKIRLSKVNLELWIDNQDQWLDIQPTFLVPQAATKLQVTFKIYEKMQRIWRRLIRLARDNNDILELLSENTTMASLQQFANLLGIIHKSLEEYMRPKGSDDSDDD